MSDYCIDCAMPQTFCKNCSFGPSLKKTSDNKITKFLIENANSRLKIKPRKIMMYSTPNRISQFYNIHKDI